MHTHTLAKSPEGSRATGRWGGGGVWGDLAASGPEQPALLQGRAFPPVAEEPRENSGPPVRLKHQRGRRPGGASDGPSARWRNSGLWKPPGQSPDRSPGQRGAHRLGPLSRSFPAKGRTGRLCSPTQPGKRSTRRGDFLVTAIALKSGATGEGIRGQPGLRAGGDRPRSEGRLCSEPPEESAGELRRHPRAGRQAGEGGTRSLRGAPDALPPSPGSWGDGGRGAGRPAGTPGARREGRPGEAPFLASLPPPGSLPFSRYRELRGARRGPKTTLGARSEPSGAPEAILALRLGGASVQRRPPKQRPHGRGPACPVSAGQDPEQVSRLGLKSYARRNEADAGLLRARKREGRRGSYAWPAVPRAPAGRGAAAPPHTHTPRAPLSTGEPACPPRHLGLAARCPIGRDAAAGKAPGPISAASLPLPASRHKRRGAAPGTEQQKRRHRVRSLAAPAGSSWAAR